MQTNKLMTVAIIKRALLERLATEKVGKSKLKGFMWKGEPYYVKNGLISKRPTCRFKEVDTAFLQELYYTHNPNNMVLLENVIRVELLPRILSEYPYEGYPDPMTLINIELGILDGEPLKYATVDTSDIKSSLKTLHTYLMESESAWAYDDYYNVTYSAISDTIIKVKWRGISLIYDVRDEIFQFDYHYDEGASYYAVTSKIYTTDVDENIHYTQAKKIYDLLLMLSDPNSLLNKARQYKETKVDKHYLVYNGLVYATDSKVSDLLGGSGMEITESILEKITKPGVSLTISKDNPVSTITMLNALMK